MKLTLAVILSVAAAVQGSDDATSDRSLQQNNYYGGNGYGGNGYGGYGGFENYDEYIRYQMSQRSFTFTGCSTVTSNYGWNSVYVTFRLCDKCNSNRNMGCDNSNGDYIISMAQFGETFSEYWAEMTYQDREAAPFACTNLDQYAEAQLNAQYYQNNGGYNGYNGNQQGGGNQNQQQWYNNNNMEYFVGPVCNGGTNIRTGLFYDEDCTNPVEGTTVADVLGFETTDNNAQPPVCVPCMQTNYNNGGGQGELNPLCDRMLEEAGRCDRTRRQTDYDTFWQNNMQQGGGENRYNYGNACSLIDSLPHMKTANRRTTALRASIWSVVAVSVILIGLFVHKKGYLKNMEGFKGIKFVWSKKNKNTETQYAGGDYHRDDAAMT